MAVGWKLNIEFRDMFFLVTYKNGHGAVVLLPHKQHSCVLWIDDPTYSYGLYRAQVDFEDGNGDSLFGKPVSAPSKGNLVSANYIFSAVKVRSELIEDSVVPYDLNARIVLGRGRFDDPPARDMNARFKWAFPNGKQAYLTDRLRFEVDMPPGDGFMFITRHDQRVDKIRLVGGDHKLTIWNRDLRDVGEEPDLPPNLYELGEYDTLHALIDESNQNPRGYYPAGLHTSAGGKISNDEPICGGEQGEPDPPPGDPPPHP